MTCDTHFFSISTLVHHSVTHSSHPNGLTHYKNLLLGENTMVSHKQ